MAEFIKKNNGLVIITLVYLLTFLLMLPLRNVAYSDDFAYIRNAENFLKTGKLVITDWSSSSLIFPILWGSLFSKIFGYSIKTLDLSNIFLFLFALYAFYLTLKELKLDNKKSTIFTLFLLSYPWIFSFLYSFMSDVFYLSLLIISVFFYVRGLNRDKLLYYFWGSIFAGLAFLTRQIAVVIPISFALIQALKFIKEKKSSMWKIIYSISPAALIIAWYYWWTASIGQTVAYYAFFSNYSKTQILPRLIPNVWNLGSSNVLYQDLFLGRPSAYVSAFMVLLLPIFLIFKIKVGDVFRFLFKNKVYILISSSIVLVYSYLDKLAKIDAIRPPTGQVLSTDLLIGGWNITWPTLFIVSLPFWVAFVSNGLRKLCEILRRNSKKRLWVTTFAIVTFLGFLIISHYNLIRLDWQDLFRVTYANDPISFFIGIMRPQYFAMTIRETWVVVFVVTIIFLVAVYIANFVNFKNIIKLNLCISFIALLLISQFLITNFLGYTIWEEYTIPWIPLLIILIAYSTSKINVAMLRAVIILLLIFVFTIGLVRDRYQEQGLRWELGQTLVNQGIEPRRILDQNWSWLPYWYWESEFGQMVKMQYGGDKYKVPPSNFNPVRPTIPEGYVYTILATENNKNISFKGTDAFIYSKPYWVFDKSSPFFIHFKRLGVVKVMYP